MTSILHSKPLSIEEIDIIYKRCLDFLSTKGVRVDYNVGLQILAKAGAEVDFDNRHVRFPLDLIEAALKSVPKSVTLANRDNRSDLVMPHPDGLFYPRSNTGARSYLDADSTTCRDVTVADVEEWGQLTDALDNMDACCFLTPRDVPAETADIHSLKAVLENTTKPIIVQPHSFHSIPYLLELMKVAASSANDIKGKPIIVIMACSITPFIFKDMDIEVIIQASRHGVPILAASLPSAGATSPVTIAGTVLVAGIEVLAMLVMSQLIKPGLPVIGAANFYSLNMLDGRNTTGNVESALGSAAVVQFIKDAFNIPTHTLGFGTDSYIPDGQYMIETTLKALTTSLAGADILGAGGRINALSASSPIQLIIDDVIAGIAKRLRSGVKVNDDTIAWEEVMNTAPGDHFLKRAHTLKHCREALRTDLFISQSYDIWKLGGEKDLYKRAVERYKEFKQRRPDNKLPEDALSEMTSIVKKADESLAR